ncbi:MAG: hypothetical protein ACKO5C_06475 [Ferruginibacter sp.]
MKDGTYKLNEGMMRSREPYGMKAYPFYSPRFININSGIFPATFAWSEKSLDFLDMVHFTFTMNGASDINLPLSKKWMLADETSAEVYGLERLRQRYDDRFAGAAQQLVSKKKISKYEVSPVASSIYGEREMYVNDLVFDFECLGVWCYSKKDNSLLWGLVLPGFAFIPVTPNFWMLWAVKHKGGDYYPSNALFQLNVRDVTGNLIKSYRQAIFIGERHKYFKSGSIYTVNRDLLLASLPVAMESLVNRFLNDEQTLANTQRHLQNLRKKEQQNPNLLELARAQAKLNMLYRRKSSFVAQLGENANNIQQLGNSTQSFGQYLNTQQQLNRAVYTDPTQQQMANLGSTAGLMLGNMFVKGAINQNAREAARIGELFQQTLAFEKQYFEEMSQLIESDKELSALVSKSQSVNQFFQDEFKRVTQVKEESKQKTQAVNEVVKQSFSQTLTDFASRNNINLAQMSAIGAGENPPPASAASPAAGKGSKTAVDPCARKFEAAWRNTAEYKKWKSTGNYADQCMAEWKQGMLILEYCGSVLPEPEKAAIRKVAEQCRQRANQVRSASGGGIRN